jgi:hypothetical protein
MLASYCEDVALKYILFVVENLEIMASIGEV